MKTQTTTLLALILVAGGCSGDLLTAPGDVPEVITLPDGFSPEGIAFGRGSTFYVGSMATGAIFRGDARTGSGSLVVPAQADRIEVGIEYDQSHDRLFAAGAETGQAYVYDATKGTTLNVYQLTPAGTGLINDVAVTRQAAYFTDSHRAVIYRLPLDAGGGLPSPEAVKEIPLTGDFEQVTDFDINGNGIVATPDEQRLIIGNTATGKLFLVDPQTGHSTKIDLGGESAEWADGLLLVGQTLYVVQGALGQISAVRMSANFTSGTVERVITNQALAFPSAVGSFGDALYAVNARLDVEPGPGVAYQVVRVPR